jgi:hypothetical protein
MGFKTSEHGKWELTDISPSKLKTWMTCPKQFDYKYVTRAPSHSGLAMLQGSSLHDVTLEEFLQGGEQNVEALVELMELDLRERIANSDPRDYKTGKKVDVLEIESCIEQLKVWGKGLLDALKTGKDSYDNDLNLKEIVAVEIEKKPLEVNLPKSGMTIRIRGFIDYIDEEGTPGDLKLASNYYKAVWTVARAITEVQAVMYRMLVGGPGAFEYLIVDKKQNNKKQAFSPTVRKVRFEVSQRDIDRVIDTLDAFVTQTDLANGYENGFFPPIPEYNGETKADAGKTERNFCGKLCSFKDICYKENFAPPGEN